MKQGNSHVEQYIEVVVVLIEALKMWTAPADLPTLIVSGNTGHNIYGQLRKWESDRFSEPNTCLPLNERSPGHSGQDNPVGVLGAE